MKFTVLLLAPDYCDDVYDNRIGEFVVTAVGPIEASNVAVQMAMDQCNLDDPEDADDFIVIAVYMGEHINLKGK